MGRRPGDFPADSDVKDVIFQVSKKDWHAIQLEMTRRKVQGRYDVTVRSLMTELIRRNLPSHDEDRAILFVSHESPGDAFPLGGES